MKNETKDMKWLTERCKWADNVTYLSAVRDTLTMVLNESHELGLKVQVSGLVSAVSGNIRYIQEQDDKTFEHGMVINK